MTAGALLAALALPASAAGAATGPAGAGTVPAAAAPQDDTCPMTYVHVR